MKNCLLYCGTKILSYVICSSYLVISRNHYVLSPNYYVSALYIEVINTQRVCCLCDCMKVCIVFTRKYSWPCDYSLYVRKESKKKEEWLTNLWFVFALSSYFSEILSFVLQRNASKLTGFILEAYLIPSSKHIYKAYHINVNFFTWSFFTSVLNNMVHQWERIHFFYTNFLF